MIELLFGGVIAVCFVGGLLCVVAIFKAGRSSGRRDQP